MWQESSFHEKKKKIPWTLTKEGPTREVKNDHESLNVTPRPNFTIKLCV